MQKQTYPSDGVISHWDFLFKTCCFCEEKKNLFLNLEVYYTTSLSSICSSFQNVSHILSILCHGVTSGQKPPCSKINFFHLR